MISAFLIPFALQAAAVADAQNPVHNSGHESSTDHVAPVCLYSDGTMGVRAIAQASEVPLGSVHRILNDLTDEGVVSRTRNGGWELSFRLPSIVGPHMDRLEFPKIARPFCEEITREFQESVSVSGLNGNMSICLDKVRANEGMQLDASVGFRAPLSCGGGGKAILSWLAPETRERVLADALPALTEHSIVDRTKLQAEIAETRMRGCSIDREEVVVGVHCIGMPIPDMSGSAVGAISISRTRPKTPGDFLDRMIGRLSEACEYVSRRIGYGSAWPPLADDGSVALKAGE